MPAPLLLSSKSTFPQGFVPPSPRYLVFGSILTPPPHLFAPHLEASSDRRRPTDESDSPSEGARSSDDEGLGGLSVDDLAKSAEAVSKDGGEGGRDMRHGRVRIRVEDCADTNVSA